METGGSNAYGASLAGGAFDFKNFLKQPHTIARILSWVFAIVVFACITAEGYVNPSPVVQEAKCVFNQNDSACHYGVGIGVLAFLASTAFLALDLYFPQISNAKERKYIVTADLVFSAAWTFLWFVCFCLLANQWSNTVNIAVIPADAARAAIAFSFFSIGTWGTLTAFTLNRYRQGVQDFSQNYNDPANNHATPYPPSYPPYPTGETDSYQQPPFPSNQQPQGEGSYQPPVF